MNRVRLSAFAAALLLAFPAASPAKDSPPDEAEWSHAVDLMPLIDPAKDAVKGEWRMEDSKLVSENIRQARIQIPFEPPNEYDFRIIFTCSEGVPSAAQYVTHGGHCTLWLMGTGGNKLSKFIWIDDKRMEKDQNKAQTDGCLEFNHEFTSVLQIREGGVAAYLDGKLINRWVTDYKDAVKLHPDWAIPNLRYLAVGSDGTITSFRKIEVLEINGKGKVGSHPDSPLTKRETEKPKTKTDEPRPRVAGFADAESQKDAKKFARKQSSIKGLYVVKLGNGQRLGSAQDIIGTAERAQANRETVCDFAADVAKDTRLSMEEAERLLKLRYPVWQAGYRVRFSYGDKYVKQAGGSAGGAFSVLLLSLLDGFQIDPGFSMTGDVTVDGKIRKVGAVAEKIRGAMLEKCSVVAIPQTNKENLTDLAILYSPAMFWSIQILSVNTLDEAVAMARLDKTQNMSRALTMFYQVQRNLGPNAPLAWLRNQDTYLTLQQVLQLAPNHLSAEFMLRTANNQLPATLSLNGSIEEIWAASAMMQGLWADEKTLDPKKDSRYRVTQVPSEAIRVALDRLTWLENRVHPKTRDFRAAMYDYIHSVDNLRRQGGVSSAIYGQYLARRDRVLGELVKLGTDRNALEEMMH